MRITEEMLSALREKIRPYLTEKRYVHTLAVEKAAAELGKVYLSDQTEKLRVSALLHDITKKADLEKQLQYCTEFAIMVSETDLYAPKIFHLSIRKIVTVSIFPDRFSVFGLLQ